MLRRAVTFACLLMLVLGLAGCKRDPLGNRAASTKAPQGPPEEFLRLMNAGKNYLDRGDATNALALYQQALAIVPQDVDVRLNLANSYLLAGSAAEAIEQVEEALALEPNSAAAFFIKGSACLRLSRWEEAVIALENARKIEPGEPATLFQLGRARMELRQWEEAIAAFREGIAMDPNRLRTTAHYLLAQALRRAGREDEAQEELQQHLASLDVAAAPVNTVTFERSKYTLARVPFRLEQPEVEGVKIRFVDATREAFGGNADLLSGPIGVMAPNHTVWYGLFVLEPGQGFRLLGNSNGTFHLLATPQAAIPGARYDKVLVGDLQNDRFDEVIVLGDQGSHLFRFGTNGQVADASSLSQLANVNARDGTLIDLDFTGKLDLVAVTAHTNDVRVLRQSGPLIFRDASGASGIPASLHDARSVVMEDWNRDGIMDLVVGRKDRAPLLLEKQRGGQLVAREQTNWTAGAVFCAGDFDNDLRPDLAVVGDGKISICFNGGMKREIAVTGTAGFQRVVAVDYDNDGWLDLWCVGQSVRAWRNVGLAGFREETAQLGLDQLAGGTVAEIHFADFDADCDADAVMALASGGLRYLRNEGGNAQAQVKVQLQGNRSNASGIGCKVEIETGGLRLLRTVQALPLEIGVGKHRKLDSFLVHWANWPQGSADVVFDCREPLWVSELTIQEGSCPYLYAWDGRRFRFVTDILGAAPLGLPVAEGRYTEADPEEYVWIGNDETFPAREGSYQVRITEELREVLYLDEAKLVVVDHPPGTEVHATDKLLPAGPFPPGTLMTLHRERPLQRAETLTGQEVTAALKTVDGRRVSPPEMRVPQLRGLAEPHGWVLDFGPLDTSQPLVLVLNGWIRFGGGMANIAAAHDPSLPFPFPSLDAEVAPGIWQAVDVVVGAPAGKTKTILVDLEGKLKPGTRRLRLTGAFEIHWDRIALMEKGPDAASRVSILAPTAAHLRFRGFSALEDLPADWPATPDYDRVSPNPYWTIIPGGWCTRYGDVAELVAARDEGLALINAGDELSLEFAADSLPSKPAGSIRDFFLYTDGWDKDSDFHVAAGTRVEPLPFHGMRDDLYGQEQRPAFPSDELHRKYNTRWVEGGVLKQTARRQ
jgi:Flp pilus assembly protein TadD